MYYVGYCRSWAANIRQLWYIEFEIRPDTGYLAKYPSGHSLEKYPDSPFKNFLDKPDTELIFGWLPELKKVLWSIPSSNKT